MSFTEFLTGFLGASTIEIIASISGLLCVYLLIKRNIWCWFFGFIQVTLFSYVFFHAKLYSDTGLHIIYMFLQIYGWWNWQHNRGRDQALIIEKGNTISLCIWFSVALIGTLLLGTLTSQFTDASFAYADAFTTCASLVAQFLLTRRYLYNWLFWIIVDVVAIYIYFQKGLLPTSTLYAVFLVMSVVGYLSWLKQTHLQVIDKKAL